MTHTTVLFMIACYSKHGFVRFRAFEVKGVPCKYCCYLWEWAVAQEKTTTHRGNVLHEQLWCLGKKNITEEPLVNPKIVLPPLHIKFGLLTDFVKAVHRNDAAFQYLCKKFPRLSTEITKGSPQIGQLLGYAHFESTLTPDQLHAWHCFRNVTTLFLRNRRT